jgi:hypothetical protein
MAKELYVSGNYVIVVDENNYTREFPIGKTIYTEKRAVHFEIIEGQIEGSNTIIPLSDAVNWVDDGATPYTEASMRTFLRENTGFSPASGGSGAEPQKAYLGYMTQVGLNAPTLVTIFSNFAEPPTFAYSGLGQYIVTFNVADNPQVMKMTTEQFTSTTTAKFNKVLIQDWGFVGKAVSSYEEDTSGGDKGTYILKDDILDGVNTIVEFYEY